MTFELTPADGCSISGLAHMAAVILEGQEHLDTRLLATVGGEWIIQGYSRNDQLLRWVGLDRHIILTLTPAGTGYILVRASSGSRLLRSALILTGTLVACWPLAVTAAVGAVRNRLLMHRMIRLLRSSAPPACLPDGYPL